MFVKKRYSNIVLGIFLSGCATEMMPEPRQVSVSQTTDSYHIDRNLIDYHVNKKKIRYKIKKSTSVLGASPLLGREGKNFDDVNVSKVENSKDYFHKNFALGQTKFKN